MAELGWQNFLLRISYKGSDFRGWQAQPGVTTVQELLENSLATFYAAPLKKFGAESHVFTCQGAGRTDAGVHALDQCVNVLLPDLEEFDIHKVSLGLTEISGRRIVVNSISPVDMSFHARFSPHVKEYHYNYYLKKIPNWKVREDYWAVGPVGHIGRMIEVSSVLKGTHDFSSFRASDCEARSAVRTIEAIEVVRHDEFRLQLRVRGTGFLKQMIRIIAGTIVESGKGNLEVNEIRNILDAKNRTFAKKTAPAQGLTLVKIQYRS